MREVINLSQSFEESLLFSAKTEDEVITSYKFGVIIIGGKQYTSDVIIYPDRVDDKWWRKRGHLLLPQDLEEAVKEKPAVIIVGTGNPGLMKVPSTTLGWVKSKGIDIKVEPTKSACRTYNQFYHSRKTIAVLHLTC